MEVSPREKLNVLIKRFVTAVLESQKYIAIFSREEKNLQPTEFDKINDMRRDFDNKLTTLLKEGDEAGEFRVPDPHMAALAIGGMVSWAYVWYRPQGRLELPEVAAEISRLVLAMVHAEAK